MVNFMTGELNTDVNMPFLTMTHSDTYGHTNDSNTFWLMQRFQIAVPSEMLIRDTRQAIADATDYDEREMNYNFDYDYAAYNTIQKNFEKLIKAGSLDCVMELALELMNSGSEQVEMSDEGLMTDDIEECLRVVIKGLKSADLSLDTVTTWAEQMLHTDRVGFICDEELGALAKQP